jgi:hypothetical protein
MSPVKRASAISVAVTLMDDKSNLISVTLSDADGLPITAAQLNGVFPAALLATPIIFVFADATPGPSAYLYTPLASPAVSTVVAGAFDIGTVTAVQPVVPGSGQAVDSTCTISGFPSGAVSEDGGTWTLVSDPNTPGGFSAIVT